MKPVNKHLQLDINEVKIGLIQSDSIEEKGKVIAVADDCQTRTHSYLGKTLYFKAWAIDVITDGDKKYYFIHEESEAICAVL